jgi:hypothetical protein
MPRAAVNPLIQIVRPEYRRGTYSVLIERALAIDPDYVDALVEKANMYAALVDQGYSSDPSADLSTALNRHFP